VVPLITGLPPRTGGYTLLDVFIRLRTNSAPDVASLFRERVRHLGRPEPHRTEAVRVRIILNHACRVGLRERLSHSADGSARG
jgi:hypothetical protein